ncbi:hypothetical protein CROQUDRAFT_99451 [Cronartium quercuum f. sp. fusiforme G11]|uniref:Uncharacterized protein n=1 Tax=Cronartium quercuum f. sp. fusiforme G11 TaxID=708437 RepID=A0A9P6NBX0_9BASI|nr:hypothetical protein CROQUDRAFT_99451 [Cronartium quercuum f. sp. fusiforme G11]
MGKNLLRRPSLPTDSHLPIDQSSHNATSSPAKATHNAGQKHRRPPSASHNSQQRATKSVRRPQTKQIESLAEAQQHPTNKVSSNQASVDKVQVEASGQTNMPSKKPSLARRVPSTKILGSKPLDDPPRISRSNSRNPVKPADPPSMISGHPSSPSSTLRQTVPNQLATKSLPFQTPVRKNSSRKVFPVSGLQPPSTANTQHPSPGALPQKSIHKSRLPVATPTITTQTRGPSVVRCSVSATDLSVHRSRTFSKVSATNSNETLSVKTHSRNTADNAVQSRNILVNSEPDGQKEDLSRLSSFRPTSRNAIAKRPPGSLESTSASESAKAEAEEIAESNLATQSIGRLFLSPVVEEISRRPMTRARSKHLLGTENPFHPEAPSGAQPSVKRRASRVMQLAQSFEDSTLIIPGTTAFKPPSPSCGASSSSIGYTPDRRISAAFSSASTISPHSPNLIALAASLSKQQVQRDRQSRARTSVSDMLRYSTMSTLGTLRWEDGAGDGLLTDENETEAMVADISMVEITPIRSETEKAALALATARSNFLAVAKEDEGLRMSGFRSDDAQSILDQHQMSSPSINPHARVRVSSNYCITPSPLAHATQSAQSPFALNDYSTPTSKVSTLMAQEARLALLSAEIEKYQIQERELKRQLQQCQTLNQAHSNHQTGPEREVLLVEEMNRLEDEIHNITQTNIDLENHLDQVNFENEGLRARDESMQRDMLKLRTEADRLQKLATASSHLPLHQLATSDLQTQIHKTLQSQRAFRHETQSEIGVIKSQLMMLSLIKISLSLQEPLAQDLDNQIPAP